MTRQLSVNAEHWPTRTPFRISGETWTGFDLITCEITEDGRTGRGEAAGVYYMNEDAETMSAQIAQVAERIEAGANRQDLLSLLPPGGARNALDCALWDLEARQAGTSVWTLAGVAPDAASTVFTIGLEDTPAAMAAKAAAACDRPQLKIKLSADRPVERIAAIRAARPDARLIADCNGGWNFAQLKQWAPQMAAFGLSLLEQPLPRDNDAELQCYAAPLPLFADESCLHLGELDRVIGRYAGIVIKLDKTGGLTEALLMARAGKKHGLRLMVGCMVATSLSMAPAHVLAQLCEFVDIDGPLFLTRDKPGGLRYEGAAAIAPVSGFWGTPA
ncbi:MAG: dipeptide epimerase [Burkholderiales bacterium]